MLSAMLFRCVFESYFDVALNVVFTDVLLLLHADSNAVPKAFHFVFYVCFKLNLL